ncbi:DNA-binding protein [Streptomyces bungoensis]|uniref:DNA-binding protein n=1 Tax=Streptomyces bungoensis TaxID=285568 RepID=A0A101T6R3_9ACTN|nr:DNA-binding protein [Streptomyces bungoensis]
MATKKTAVGEAAAKEAAAVSKPAAAEEGTGRQPPAAGEAAGTARSTRAPEAKAAGRKRAGGKAAAGRAAGIAGREDTGTEEGVGGVTAGEAGVVKAAAGDVSTGAAEKSTAKKAGAARAAKQTGATTVVAKKTPGTATADDSAVPKARVAAAEPGELAVRPGEDPWTPEEVAEARAELTAEAQRLTDEISSSETSLAGLMRDSGDGAGDDQADTGTKNITREHEMALAANAREMLLQTGRALERLDAGTYGLCENCGNPIGKARMQAFPRATLCVECKQKQERRS